MKLSDKAKDACNEIIQLIDDKKYTEATKVWNKAIKKMKLWETRLLLDSIKAMDEKL